MSKANIGDLIAVISSNSSDVVDVINKLGGVQNLLRAAPAIYRIVNTISARHDEDPVEQIQQVERQVFYGDQTREKVKQFQIAHGLEADGIIGNQTWAKVEELLKGK